MLLLVLGTITAEGIFQMIYSFADRLTEMCHKFAKLFWPTVDKKFYYKIF